MVMAGRSMHNLYTRLLRQKSPQQWLDIISKNLHPSLSSLPTGNSHRPTTLSQPPQPLPTPILHACLVLTIQGSRQHGSRLPVLVMVMHTP